MTNLEHALSYLKRGISIVPQISGEKRPAVAWSEYQLQSAPIEVVHSWYFMQPDAGMFAVLGPVSKLLVIDVDGPDGHQALVAKLGSIPRAPMVISGSGKPSRYHLYFRHPGLDAGAKATPWHAQLEFRGRGGLVVMPPSMHQSGNPYVWADGLSFDDLDPPELPEPVLQALKSRADRRRATHTASPPAGSVQASHIHGISGPTRMFLRGDFAAGPQWNSKMFAAACDLCGCGVPLTEAMPFLLAGAKPVNRVEEEKARATIESAYSQPRVAGRSLIKDSSLEVPTASWQVGEITVNEISHPRRRQLPPPGCHTIKS